MTLRKWMARQGIKNLREAGDLLGCSHSDLSRYERGVTSPRVKTALRIERATGGAVTVYDWPEGPVNEGS